MDHTEFVTKYHGAKEQYDDQSIDKKVVYITNLPTAPIMLGICNILLRLVTLPNFCV